MDSSTFNATAAKIAADNANGNLTLIAEIYKGHEWLSPKSMYSGAKPDLIFNAVAMGVFYAYTACHFILFLIYKNNFFGICMILYLFGQAIGYMGRFLAVADITGLSLNNQNYFLLQFISLTLSPNLFNAAMYSQYSKVLFTYATTRDNVYKLNVFGKRIQPMLISFLFIASDITCLLVQGAGGGIEGGSVNTYDPNALKVGNSIFITGLALQTSSMAFFLAVFLKLIYNIFIRQRIEYLNSHLDISNQKKLSYNKTFFAPWKWHAIYKSVRFEDINPIMHNIDTSNFSSIRLKLFKSYPFSLFIAFALAVLRCIYRLVELADNGFNGFLMTHEHYLVGFDFVPLSISTLIMCIYAEGVVFGKKGLLEIFLIKLSSYRGLTTKQELRVEFRHMFGLKVNNEKLNKEFNSMVRDQGQRVELNRASADMNNLSHETSRINDDSDMDLSSSHYIKDSLFFEACMADYTESPWWKFSNYTKKTEQRDQTSFSKEEENEYENDRMSVDDRYI